MLRNHADALNFLRHGLRNPNFALAGRRRALNLADFVFDRTARVARIAARDAAKDRFARNRNAFGLPATGLDGNLFRIGLRDANGVRNLFLAFDPGRFANGVLTLTLFVNRLADGVRNLLLAGFPNRLADGVLALALFVNRLKDGVRNLLLAGFPNRLADGVLALALFVDRFADGVRNLLLAGFPNRFADGVLTLALFVDRLVDGVRDLLLAINPNRLADGVLTLALFVDRLADGVRDLLLAGFPNRFANGVLSLSLLVDRLADGVRNLLLAVFPNRAVHRASDRLLAVFPNRTADGVLHFANASFRNVLRAENAAGNRNFLEGRPIANDLLLLVHDFAAGLHHRAALRREFASARPTPTIGRRAAPSGLRLFKRRRQQSRREQKRRPNNSFHFNLHRFLTDEPSSMRN